MQDLRANPVFFRDAIMKVAEALESERQRQSLTLYALAKASGMSAGQLQRVLRGETKNPGIETVRTILAAMGKSLTWLDRQLKETA